MKHERFDAVRFMRQVRDKMAEEMGGMGFEEQKTYIEKRAANVRRELESRRETTAVKSVSRKGV